MRDTLERYKGVRLQCAGRVQRKGEVYSKDELTICLQDVIVKGNGEPVTIDHLWLRRGLTNTDVNAVKVGDDITFTAKVWLYRHLDGTESYGLAYPEKIRCIESL